MLLYRHTQTGYVIIAVIAAALVVIAVVGKSSGEPAAGALPVALAIVGVVFARLTVAVEADTLRVSFTPGWPRWRWPLREIPSAGEVRNSWLAGWGIHWMPGRPGYWVINVSGFTAVELRLRNGRRYRVGTDDPDGLLTALRQGGVTTVHL